MPERESPHSISRDVPLRIVGGYDWYFTPEGNFVSVGEGILKPDMSEIHTVRFSPLVLQHEDIFAPDAAKRIMAKVRAARKDADAWVEFTNTEMAKRHNGTPPVTREHLDELTQKIEENPAAFVKMLRSVVSERIHGSTTPVNDKTLKNFERALRDEHNGIPDAMLQAFSRARIPFVVADEGHPEKTKNDFGCLATRPERQKGMAIYRKQHSADPQRVGAEAAIVAYQFLKDEPEVIRAVKAHRNGIVGRAVPLLGRNLFHSAEEEQLEFASALTAAHGQRMGLETFVPNAPVHMKEHISRFYDSFMGALAEYNARVKPVEADKPQQSALPEGPPVPLRIIGADDIYVSASGRIFSASEGFNAGSGREGLEYASLILRPSDLADAGKVKEKLKKAEADIGSYARYAYSKNPSVPLAQMERDISERYAQLHNDEEIKRFMSEARIHAAGVKVQSVSDSELSAFEGALRSNPKIMPDYLLSALSRNRVNLLLAHDLPAVLPKAEKDSYGAPYRIFYNKEGHNLLGANVNIATLKANPEAFAEYALEAASMLPYNKNIFAKIASPKVMQAIVRECQGPGATFAAQEKFQLNDRPRKLGIVNILNAMHYWLNDPRSGVDPEAVRRKMPQSVKFYEAYMNGIKQTEMQAQAEEKAKNQSAHNPESLTPEQETAYAAFWKQEEAHRVSEAREKGRKEAGEMLRVQKEARKPAPYILPAEGIYGRIVRASGDAEKRTWSGIRNSQEAEKARILSNSRRYLNREEIEPLLSTFNVKLPGHKELADVLFDENTLRRAQYACPPCPEKDDKLVPQPKDFRKRAHVALASFCIHARDMQNIPEGERWRYEHIREYLEGAPALTAAAFGTDDDLKALRRDHEQRLGEDAAVIESWRQNERIRRYRPQGNGAVIT